MEEVIQKLASMATTPPSTPAKPPIANFPLPRELRDEIYSYLLKHDKHDPEYRFHTSILAVNRTIHAEAETYLYENNDFVVASFKWTWPVPELAPQKWVRHVSAHRAAKMKYHRLRLHFAGNSASGPGKQGPAPVESVLLHLNHLPELCVAIQAQLNTGRGPCCLVHCTATGVHKILDAQFYSPNGKGVKPVTVRIELRDTKFRHITDRAQHKLLEPFSRICGIAWQLHITGSVHDAQNVEDLKMSIGPRLIWSNATYWKVLETLEDIRGFADAAFKSDDFDRAERLYCAVNTSASKFVLYLRELALNSGQTYGDVRQCLLLLMLDCLLNGMWAQLRLKRLDCFRITAKALEDFLCQYEEVLDWLNHELRIAFLRFAPFDPRPHASTIASFVQKARAEGDPHLMHDAAILARCPDQNKAVSPEDLPLEDSSVFKMPAHVNNSRSRPDVPQKPRRFVNYVDVEHFPCLTSEEKRAINEIQRSHSWPVTDFEKTLDLMPGVPR